MWKQVLRVFCLAFVPSLALAQGTWPVPIITSFSASDTGIPAGSAVTLSWTVLDAFIVIIPGITFGATSPVTIYPSATTTYTLIAWNGLGVAAAAVTVAVTSAPQIAAATVGSDTTGQCTVPPDFMGLGAGATRFEAIFGEPSTGINPLVRQVIRNLVQYPGEGPLIYKITADDRDASYIPTATDITALTQLYSDIGVKFFVGVSLAPESVSLAVAQANAFAGNMPAGSLLGLEIGNEPDHYLANNNEASCGKGPCRTAPYNYIADYGTFAPAVLAALNAYQPASVKVIGPVWGDPATEVGGSPKVVNNSGKPVTINDFLASESSDLSFVTQHGYGNQCLGNDSLPDFLLSENAQSCIPDILAGVAPTHALGLKYRLGESNSITGGGINGASNAFESALWALDWCSRLAQGGVDGINFFGDTNNNYYTMFAFNTSVDRITGLNDYSMNYITPQYYGLLMFQQATQNNSTFLPVTMTSHAGNQVIHAWMDASSTIRVLVLNKDGSSGNVTLTLPNGYGPATAVRLLLATPNATPSYLSTFGVTLAGQTFDTSLDATIQGTAYGETITPSGSDYTFSMPATSAVLVTAPHSRH